MALSIATVMTAFPFSIFFFCFLMLIPVALCALELAFVVIVPKCSAVQVVRPVEWSCPIIVCLKQFEKLWKDKNFMKLNR